MSQQKRGIVREIHDEPHIEGRRITVRFVRQRVEEDGVDPEAFARRYELDLADVYRALTYYHDNAEEMAAVERRRTETVKQYRTEAVTGPEDLSVTDSGS